MSRTIGHHHRNSTARRRIRMPSNGRRIIPRVIRCINSNHRLGRHRRSPTATTTRCSPQQPNPQQRRPPEERHHHRTAFPAQSLPGLHPIPQHGHRIRRLCTLRHIRIDIAVLVRTHQHVVHAAVVTDLAVVLVVVLDHQIRLIHIAAFKRNVQVLAHPLRRDVLGAEARRLIREVIVHIGLRLDMHCLALGTHSALAPVDLAGQDGFSCVVDAEGDVLETHDVLSC